MCPRPFGEGSRDRFARALFAFVSLGLGGCVDKTPPPLWPTPPPPTLATPIGGGVATTAATATTPPPAPEPEGERVGREVSSGELGPWRPTPGG